MQDAGSVLRDRFAEVLARLPADLDLDDLAMESKAIQRRREVVEGAALLRIALARGPGGLSLRQTAAWASMQGIAALSNPGVKYRTRRRSFSPSWWNGCLQRHSPARSCAGPAARCAWLTAPASAN